MSDNGVSRTRPININRYRMKFPRFVLFLSILLELSLGNSSAQQGPPDHSMDGMNMPSAQMSSHEQMGGMAEMMDQMHPKNFIQEIRHHAASGTSAEPNSVPAPMLMSMIREWMLMFHWNAFVVDTQQSSPRGGDKFYSTNWFMPMAQRSLGPGQLTVRAMFSLEPATVSDRRYPLLFQQGETAYGVPIADGQHPHDFFMETAALYDVRLGEHDLLSFYVAPIGDPAIGPTAYPHRASASENPIGTLGHHQQDSTHIAGDVVTLGFTHSIVRIEASGFHGREPDEFRWNIDQGRVDSWSTRATLQPGQYWSGQLSYARIKSPEALFPAEDQARTTASLMYNRPFGQGHWASTALWGRTRSLNDSAKENSYLFESTLKFRHTNYAWVRLENAGRSNELLVGERVLPPGFKEEPLTHVQACTYGYDREARFMSHLSTAIGAQLTAYHSGKPLQPVYGASPIGVSVFIRLRPVNSSN